jgi:hypothetical protein
LGRGGDVDVMRHQWNTLRVGDAVLVHTDRGSLVAATVAFVDGESAANTVGVRLDEGDETYYTWPSPADVHSDPVELTESCVHCRLLRTLDITDAEREREVAR